MALARTADDREYTAPGFSHEAHDRWVKADHCPVVSLSKTWCSKLPGHGGLHGSPNAPVNADRGPYWIEWDR